MITGEDVGRGIQALQRYFGMLPKAPVAKVWSIRGHLKRWLAPSGGVLTWHRRAGEHIQQGESLATLYTRQGKQELASPYSGLLLLKNPTQAPHERQELAKFLLE
jgi:predicted deacylase